MSVEPAATGTAGATTALSRHFLLVGIGLGAIGAGSLAVLAIASRSLSASGFAGFGVWFGFVNLVAFGLFSPLETTVSRSMLATGGLTRLMKRHAATYAGVVLLSICALSLVLQSIVVPRLMAGSWALVAVTLVYIVLLAAQAFQRGVSVGHGEYRPLFWQFTIDGVLRVLLALAAVERGADSALAFASCVAVSAAAGVLVGFAAMRSRTEPGVAAANVGLGGAALASLVVAAIGAQVLANGAPPILSVIGRDDARTMALLVGALTLTRIPLLFTAAIQAPLLPPLVRLIENGDEGGVWLLVRRLGTVLVITCLAAAVIGWYFGQSVLQTFLGTRDVAEPLALAVLAASGVALLATLAVQAALIAAGAHRALVYAWLLGVAVFILTTASDGTAIAVAPLAIALGTVSTLVSMLIGLRLQLERDASTR